MTDHGAHEWDDLTDRAKAYDNFTRIREPLPISATVEAAARAYAMENVKRENDIAFDAAVRSLRPRLRWAANSPKALRALKRLGMWWPPTLNYNERGELIGVTRR